MKFAAFFFFYCYIGLVLAAGFWGAFLGADFDHQMLFKLDTGTLSEYSRTNMLSQYRFLRAMEFGYGLFAITFRKEIFSVKKFNRLYLVIMLAGVLARIVSLVDEGSPSALFWFFLAFESLGVVIIYIYFNQKKKPETAEHTHRKINR
ncbi:DUF4345 domain-containing protein [Halalkalibaculum sp. DA3122]|uniref:DUF4345 domain-containing protein n=1 Tax=Halalkalibaculum sp. DA3122 TaxID=3373607 RepID=UPI003753F408